MSLVRDEEQGEGQRKMVINLKNGMKIFFTEAFDTVEISVATDDLEYSAKDFIPNDIWKLGIFLLNMSTNVSAKRLGRYRNAAKKG